MGEVDKEDEISTPQALHLCFFMYTALLKLFYVPFSLVGAANFLSFLLCVASSLISLAFPREKNYGVGVGGAERPSRERPSRVECRSARDKCDITASTHEIFAD